MIIYDQEFANHKPKITFAINEMPQFSNQNNDQTTLESIPMDSIDYVTLKEVVLPEFNYLQNKFNPGVLVSDPDLSLAPLPFSAKVEMGEQTMFWVYAGVLMFWSLFFQKSYKALANIGNIYVSNSALYQEVNDRSSGNGLISIAVFFSSIVVMSIFGFQFLNGINPSIIFSEFYQTYPSIFIIGFILIIYLFIKSMLVFLTSVIFKSEKILSTYLTLNVNSIQILGVILFPIIVASSFGLALNSRWVLGFGLVLIITFFITRLVRSFILAVKQTNSQVFHIILYICTLEILSLLVISKLLFI